MTIAAPALLRAGFSAEVAGHAIDILPDGPARLARMLAMMDAARSSIRMMFYIYASDAAGQAVLAALVAATRRGVMVDLLLDSFGSAKTADAFFAPLRAAGGRVRWFGTRWTPLYLIRNHQKLLLVDSRFAMIGGFNIEGAYFAPADDADGWQDIALIISGPQVAGVVRWFDALSHWMDRKRPRFGALRRLVRGGIVTDGIANSGTAGGEPVRWLVGGPTPRLSPWTAELRRLLIGGQRLAMSMAYFSPNAAVLRRLARMVRRGGTVELMLPARSDNAATIGAARLSYSYLLKRGVRIWEYERSPLHNKLCVIDDVVLIGSANVDMRSLFVNMELMLRVEDAGFARQCRALIDAQKGGARAVTLAAHHARAGWWTRLRWALAWLVVGVIDYSVTRRLNFGLDEDPSLDADDDDERDVLEREDVERDQA